MKNLKLKKSILLTLFAGLIFFNSSNVKAFDFAIKNFDNSIEIDAISKATDPNIKKKFHRIFYYSSVDAIPDKVWHSEGGYAGYLYYTGQYNYENGRYACGFSGYLWKGPFVPPKAILWR